MEFDEGEVYDFAVELARRAGEIIKEGFLQEKRIEFKTSAIDLVTEYDKRVEDVVFAAIRKRFPGHKLIGEESTAGEN
jgi:fructose-1,6-bisphosphatase/inositol monophosphatase family enzyme